MDLVALVVGVAAYPKLRDWDIADDKTVYDAIAVATSLLDRGVAAEKIKLLLSGTKRIPKRIRGITVHPACKRILDDFLTLELGTKPFDGKSFFFFWSGHGVIAQGVPQTIVFTADSAKRNDATRIFNYLGIDEMRSQLLGMESFEEQTFCVNACRTPSEWSMSELDHKFPVATLKTARSGQVRQTQFYAVKEGLPASIDHAVGEFSTKFARHINRCLKDCETWPPNRQEWLDLVLGEHPEFWSPDSLNSGQHRFRPLMRSIRSIDRDEQHITVKQALKYQRSYQTSNDGWWSATVIDFHSYSSDHLNLCMSHIEEELIDGHVSPEGVHRFNHWPDRTLPLSVRQKHLVDELVYRLTDECGATDPDDIARALYELGQSPRILYIEIIGPCDNDDRYLVDRLLALWRDVIFAALRQRTKPLLPLLIVGHVDPDPTSAETNVVDTITFYEASKRTIGRRLGLVNGNQLRKWLEKVAPKQKTPWRPEIEAAIAKEFDVTLVEEIAGVRMARVVQYIASQAGNLGSFRAP